MGFHLFHKRFVINTRCLLYRCFVGRIIVEEDRFLRIIRQKHQFSYFPPVQPSRYNKLLEPHRFPKVSSKSVQNSCSSSRDSIIMASSTDFISVQNIQNSEDLQDAVKACSTCLLNGGVIAVPTDTIYGIAGLSQQINAVNRIYEIKQRNYQNPVAISVGCVDDIFRWSNVTVPRELLTELLPGPVTVVFERKPELNPSLNPHTSKVGIRIPGNTFMQQLATKCGSPIALTSANISGGRSCLKTEEFEYLWPQLDAVVNGGVLNDTEESRLGSTVVDLSVPGSFRIIRNGSAHQPTTKILQDKYKLKNDTCIQPLN